MYPEATKIKTTIDSAKKIVVIQADNPDADSLGTALAWEQILDGMGKDVSLYCGVDVPTYLRYLAGWDRIDKELPKQFDASIIVDASTLSLLDKLQQEGQLGWVAAKPTIVLDHHEIVERTIDFAEVIINDPERSSTGELTYFIAKQLELPLNTSAREAIMTAILGDTQGLTNQLASADTYKVMSELVEQGADRIKLEESRRELSKMPAEIYKYKAVLIGRTIYAANGKVAYVMVPQTEINKFSPLYNPAPLIQADMLQTTGVAVAIVFKSYDDGRVTAAIRSNYGFPIAADLAGAMGGGGHAYASGFKDTSNKSYDEIQAKCLTIAEELIGKLEKD
jgi:phosphoesterase RecJ-like protein